jgi:hypothetical protein
MELSLSRSLPGSKSFVLRQFLCSISKTVSFARPALRPGRRAVKVGRCTSLAACSAFAMPYLNGFEGDGTLTRSGFVKNARYAEVDWAGKTDLAADCRQRSDANTNCSEHNRLRQFQPSGKPLAYADDDQ